MNADEMTEEEIVRFVATLKRARERGDEGRTAVVRMGDLCAVLDGWLNAGHERDEARAEVERLRAELADHHTASVLPRETALRETAEALGFTHMGAQGFAGMARRQRDAAIAAEREACAVICEDAAGAEASMGDAERAEGDDGHADARMTRASALRQVARAIRARGAGGAR